MTLRLTLRTLLSYLDDTLDPAQAKAIGQKVAESEQARELMERIKQVTRRRRLTTPPAAGPGGIDANTIAEYLDNEVSPEQAAEVEQICLASDVHLAEVAACHQILTLVLGEPALVPPSAKQRMYGLVKGPEAIPFRKPPKAGTKADLDLSTSDMNHAGDESAAGFASAFKNPGTRNTLLLAGGSVLVACLLVAVLWQIIHPGSNNNVNQTRTDQLASADSAKDKDKDKDKDEGNPPEPEKKEHADLKKDKKKEIDDKKDKDEKVVVKKTTPDKDPFEVIPVPTEEPEIIAFAPPDLKPAVLGQYEPNQKKPQILLQRGLGEKGGWERLWGKSLDVASARPLLSLPAMKNEVHLKNGVDLTLWGTAPEIWPNLLIFESMVELYPHKDLDVDMTLRRGRIIIANRKTPSKSAVVRVRFEDPTQQKQSYFDITLRDNATEVAIERMCGFPQNEPFYDDLKDPNRRGPDAELLCFFLKGGGTMHASDVTFSVDATAQPQWMRWSSSKGLDTPRPGQAPDWILPDPKLSDPKDRAQTLKAAQMLADNVQIKKLDVALQEAMGLEVDPPSRLLALRCYTAMDEFSVPLEMLNQENPREGLRRPAIQSLRHWMAQERDNEYKLYQELKTRSGNIVARKVMELLHGVSAAEQMQPATYQRLIENLNNSEVALRELSAWNLEVLAPAHRKINYPAGAPYGIASAPQAERLRAQAAWRQAIPPGTLPVAPKKN